MHAGKNIRGIIVFDRAEPARAGTRTRVRAQRRSAGRAQATRSSEVPSSSRRSVRKEAHSSAVITSPTAP